MTFSQTIKLLFAAATWGASHVLVRMVVPELGPTLTAFARMSIGAITLFSMIIFAKNKVNLKDHWRFYLAVGLLNTAIPLTLFSFASVYLPAAYLVIMNATSPIFSAIFSSLFLSEAFGFKKGVSLILGLGGVILLSEFGSVTNPGKEVYLAIGGCLIASACYGLGGVTIKKFGKGIDSVSITGLSNVLGTILIFPASISAFQSHGPFLFQAHSFFSVLASLLILGVLGTGIAFVVFYKLIPEIGAFKASLVTFLMPVFGFVWGAIFLDEPLTPGTLVGAALVVFSTALFMKRPSGVAKG